MKAYITCDGEEEVGIVDLGVKIDDKETRKFFRECLVKCFSEIWDDNSTYVVFEDEFNDEGI